MDGKKSRWTEKWMDRSQDGQKKWMERSQDGQASVVCVRIIFFISKSCRNFILFYFIFHLDTSYILSKMSPYYLKLPILGHIYNLRVCETHPLLMR